jgi:hypothetical protein
VFGGEFHVALFFGKAFLFGLDGGAGRYLCSELLEDAFGHFFVQHVGDGSFCDVFTGIHEGPVLFLGGLFLSGVGLARVGAFIEAVVV